MQMDKRIHFNVEGKRGGKKELYVHIYEHTYTVHLHCSVFMMSEQISARSSGCMRERRKERKGELKRGGDI